MRCHPLPFKLPVYAIFPFQGILSKLLAPLGCMCCQPFDGDCFIVYAYGSFRGRRCQLVFIVNIYSGITDT